MKKVKTIEDFLAESTLWRSEIELLREILLPLGLEETIKWGGPVYVHAGKNVVGIGAFKSYFGLWFFQGGLLADKHKKLQNAQEGRTKALRQMRFHSVKDVSKRVIVAYVKEAMKLAEEGKEIGSSPRPAMEMPTELQFALNKKKLQSSFANLTPGRQREYCEYVAEAKQEATRIRRVEKILPLIAAGVGINDKYRS